MEIDDLLADLDPDQRAAVLSEAAPLCIIAPAGSGKTRVLTHRIGRRLRDGSADADHVLVLTFTRRAAGELTRRLRRLGGRDTVIAGTFHGLAYRFLRQRWDDQHRRAPQLMTNRLQLVQELLRDGGSARSPGRGGASSVAAEIDWARARRVEPTGYLVAAAKAGRRPTVDPNQVATLYVRYEETKRERRLVDFDDLLSLLAREIDRDPAYAAAVRWRVRHLFVDEFQDVNPLQHALLEAWRGGRDDLCVVGDPSQAIYGWTGADGRWLADFAELHPAATVVRLGTTHRSTPQIVSFGHAVLTGAREGGPTASRPDGPRPRVHRFDDRAQEAAGVAALVRTLRRPGGRWSAVAVLARTNAQLEPVAGALAASGIPARRRGAEEVDPALAPFTAELRSVTGRGSLRAWLDEVRTTPTDGPIFSPPDRPSAGRLPPDERPDPSPPAALLQAAEDLLAQEPTADGALLRTWLATGGRGDGLAADDDAVALLTFHAAKGLEWPAVVVVGAAAGQLPHTTARTRTAQEEERRLFHVAVTRAERELHVTWSGPSRSPYLEAFDLDDEPAVAPPPALRPVGPAPQPDPVLTALRGWRKDAARAARIDEAAVVDDRTLAAVADARPITEEALASVAGFGPLMARRHGARLLAAIRAVSEPTP